MAFCSFSSEVTKSNFVNVESTFISDFLPILPDACTKVYLYGLYNCHVQNEMENQMQTFVNKLNLSEVDIESCFGYLEEMGLVYVVKSDPIHIKYLPVSKSSATLMKFNKDKYKNFNIKLQDIVSGRVLTPTEFNEFYYTMESLHIEPDAMLMVARYAADLKGKNVGYKYVLTIAKNWAYEGITTCEQVEQRLLLQQATTTDLGLVLKALGLRRSPNAEDYQLYLAWTNDLDFETPVLVFLAAKAKKSKGGVNRLDYLVNKFYKMRLSSKREIEDYMQLEEAYYAVAKTVCKNIGVRYENLEIVVETYVSAWMQNGFDEETLAFISKHAFVAGIKSLKGLHNMIERFYKMGLVTLPSLQAHLEELNQVDEKIKQILNDLGIVRYVNNYDRSYYHTWMYTWNTPNEVLQFAISQSKDKVQPMQFLNKLLSVYHSKQIVSVEQAKQEQINFASNTATKTTNKPSKQVAAKEYSKEQLNSLFTSIEEVEI